jgi:hypothetical protein
MRAT